MRVDDTEGCLYTFEFDASLKAISSQYKQTILCSRKVKEVMRRLERGRWGNRKLTREEKMKEVFIVETQIETKKREEEEEGRV